MRHIVRLVLVLFPVWASAIAIPSLESQHSPVDSFSLSVSRKNAGKRDFVKEWAAVRQKWGGSNAGPASYMFSLADEGMYFLFLLFPCSGRLTPWPDRTVDVEPIGNDDLYLAEVQVGNPPQTVRMALDTGSSDV